MVNNMRIEDSIALQNARQKIKNKKLGRALNFGCINKANLGRTLFPNLQKKAPLTRMSNLIKESKLIRPKWVKIICKECGVDPNFIFGKKSVHDPDFEKLVNNK